MNTELMNMLQVITFSSKFEGQS